MGCFAPPFGLALPNGWPRRVRSAVIHAVSLARLSLITARGWAAEHRDAHVRRRAQIDQRDQRIALLEEELRIKDARMLRLPAHRRPHYTPTERLAILQLRAAYGWSMTQAARHLHVSTATISSWMRRLDEAGPAAIVRAQDPVNKFPQFVTCIVQTLKLLCPTLGTAKMAQILARAGLHLAATTVRRMQRRPTPATNPPVVVEAAKRVFSRRPNDVWLADLTTVPTSWGLWTSWLPFSLTQRWPFCWWVAVVADHYSRRIMGVAVFRQEPTSAAVRSLLATVMRQVAAVPRYLITDQGSQFTDDAFRRWCRNRGIRQRFGAVGKHGSIALIERLIKTLRNECTRRLLVPFVPRPLYNEPAFFSTWYNEERPHDGLRGATPHEIYRDDVPACRQPRFEPRARWPRASPCADPQVRVRGHCGARLDLHVSHLGLAQVAEPVRVTG